MAPKSTSSRVLISVWLAALLAVTPLRALAAGNDPELPLPTLGAFTTELVDGNAGTLRGVYVPSILADAVVQQPDGQTNYVGLIQDVITQFAAASALGSTGLLEHNYLGGAKFSKLQFGQAIYLIYGDGRVAPYMVTRILRYQALEPDSPYSDFVDLSDGKSMSSGGAFAEAYGRLGSVVFQTCIDANGNSSWGRLFVIATPYIPALELLPDMAFNHWDIFHQK